MKKPILILAYPKIDHEKDYVYYWMPYSLLTIAKAVLDEDLVEVVLFDGNLHNQEEEWIEFLDKYIENTICIGMSIMTGGGQIGHALRMIECAKQRSSAPIVLGGPHVNVLPEQTLNDFRVDAVLSGPGQASLPKFIKALLGEESLANVPGLMMKQTDGIIRGPQNPPQTGFLGAYPWHLINPSQYIRNDPTVGTKTLNYISSQGCVYKCKFCYELTYQRKYSWIKEDTLLNDITYLMNEFGINGIKFYDADWFINLKRAESFCRGLIERKLKINWAASINPNDVLRARKHHPELLTLMAESGCTRLLMGVESGSNRVLNEIVQKEITREQIIDVTQEIANNGLLGSYTFIIGFPGESDIEQEETYSLIHELGKLRPMPETRVHLFAPYPGTPLYNTSLLYGFSPPKTLAEWSNYDYYDSQTPWTNENTVRKARSLTQMRISPNVSAIG